jgi:hypothetical protein
VTRRRRPCRNTSKSSTPLSGWRSPNFTKHFRSRRTDRDVIAKKMETSANLPSGRNFSSVFSSTLIWLKDEGYIRTNRVITPWQGLVLSEKGFRALNAVPPSIGEPVGSYVSNPNNSIWQIGDAVGGLLGGFYKSMAGG